MKKIIFWKMKAITFALGISLCFALFGSPALAQEQEATLVNLVPNPSFERIGTGGNPVSWQKNLWGNIVANFSYPVPGMNGGKAVAIHVKSGTEGDAKWFFNPVPVEAGATYRFSDFSRGTISGSEINVRFTHKDGHFSYIWLADVPVSSGWRKNEAVFVVPNDVVSLTVFHLLARPGSLFTDNHSLVKVTKAPSSEFSSGMVSFSFDDAWASQYQNALPILQNVGVKGTFYITTQPVAEEWDEFMREANIRDILAKGHEIAGHTVTHADLTKISADEARKEITDSKAYLEKLGAKVTTFAYPYGAYNAAIEGMLQIAGYSSARTVDDERANAKTDNPYELKSFSPVVTASLADMKAKIDEAAVKKQWLIFSLHEIVANGREYSMTPETLRNLVEYAKSKNIPIVTVAEGREIMRN